MAIATKTDAQILAELEALVQETYHLWDEEWVRFSWRNYNFDHVQRVRALAITLTAREGGETRPLEFAALLHDITKSYDGDIIRRPDGKPELDEHGLWRCRTLLPARSNRVTQLCDELGLADAVHSISGAIIARHLLAEHDFSESFLDHVAEIIHSHLKTNERSSLQGRCISDADVMDTNIGLPAFYRNVMLTMRGMEQRFAQEGKDLDAYLIDQLHEHLAPYLREKIPTWIEGKRRDFVPQMETDAGRECALARLDRLTAEVEAMQAELDDFDRAIQTGRLAVVAHLKRQRKDPLYHEQVRYLTEEWAPVHANAGARALLANIEAENAGRC